MKLELITKGTGRVLHLHANAFGKLLYLARRNGWEPDRTPAQWPEGNWDTQVFLPYVHRYMPGRISAAEAQGLRRALIRASATGQIAIEGGLEMASETLLQAAREGSFEVRCEAVAPSAHAIRVAVPA